MKNVIISIALVLGLVGLAKASDRVYSVPMAADGTRLQRSDYSGFDYVSSSFSAAPSTACIICQGAFAGVFFSSGSLGSFDFVDVWDSSSVAQTNAIVPFRIFNSTVSNNSGSASGFQGPKYPIHFKKGLVYKPSVATYNAIQILFWGLPLEP